MFQANITIGLAKAANARRFLPPLKLVDFCA